MNATKKPRSLGRGLDALLGETHATPSHAPTGASLSPGQRAEPPVAPDSPLGAIGRRLQTLPIEFLKPNPNQPRKRFDRGEIENLAESIKVRGLIQPIVVRPIAYEHYEIVAGERRWRAAQIALVPDVPVVIRELSDEAAAEIALIENVQRVDLNPIEEAAAYQRLVDVYGRTQDEIATAVGKSRSHVANMLRLIALPPKCRKALEDGAISAGHARALLGAQDPDAALAAVLKGELSVRETEALVRRLEAAPGAPPPPPHEPGKPAIPGRKDADTRALEADLSAALGYEVAIDHSPRGAGSVTIRYRSLDQLDDICKRLTGSSV
jgi:ParB family chromosome partitioning protein